MHFIRICYIFYLFFSFSVLLFVERNLLPGETPLTRRKSLELPLPLNPKIECVTPEAKKPVDTEANNKNKDLTPSLNAVLLPAPSSKPNVATKSKSKVC